MFRQLIATLFAVLALNAFAAVDVNQASQAELESVKGIGPGLSTKIMAARKASAFKDWNDLVDRVSGVGPGNASRFSQGGLTVGGKAFDRGTVTAKANVNANAHAKAAQTAPAIKSPAAAKTAKPAESTR